MTWGFSFISKERGWPIPPEAPRTATLERLAAEVEKARLAATEVRTREAANIFSRKRWRKQSFAGPLSLLPGSQKSPS